MLKEFSDLMSILLMCLGSILIGSSAVFVRLSDLGPMTTGFYRILFALPFLFVWMSWENPGRSLQIRASLADMWGLILAGAFFALDLAFWNWSVDYTTLVNSTLLNNTAAFYVPLIMWLLFKERPSFRILITTCTGFLGCSFLVGESVSISFQSLLGDISSLFSGVMVACYLIVLQHIRNRVSTGFLMFWTGVCSLVCLAFLSYLFGEDFWPLTFRDIISVFGQAFLVHTLGQGLVAYSLGKISATYAAIILFLAPVTAAVLGWIIYAENLSMAKLLGMALVMISIVAIRNKRTS